MKIRSEQWGLANNKAITWDTLLQPGGILFPRRPLNAPHHITVEGLHVRRKHTRMWTEMTNKRETYHFDGSLNCGLNQKPDFFFCGTAAE